MTEPDKFHPLPRFLAIAAATVFLVWSISQAQAVSDSTRWIAVLLGPEESPESTPPVSPKGSRFRDPETT